MKRLALLLAAALGACGESLSPEVQDAARRLEAIRNAEKELFPLLRELEPLMREMEEARARGDRRAFDAAQARALPLHRRYEPLHEARMAHVEAILLKASARLQVKSDDAAMLDIRSQVHEMMGQVDEMLTDLDPLLRLRPADPEIAARWAGGQRRKGSYERARKRLAEVLEKHPGHARALAEDGLAAYALDAYGACVDRLEAASKSRDRFPGLVAQEVERILGVARERTTLFEHELARRRREPAEPLPQARLVTTRGAILVELFEDDAPNAVASFVSLADAGFYDGTRFHRVLPDFMAQGGDPNSRDDDPENDGQGGPGYTFRDEFGGGAYRRHFRGTLSMANSGPDTNGSQFFITHRPTEHLDGKHTVFGRVLSGMETVDALAGGDTLTKVEIVRRRNHPYQPVVERR